MHSKTNRQNHDFQIAYFLAGSCQTPDGAYALLCDLREDRENALKLFQATLLRERAKAVRAERMLLSEDEAIRLEGEADLEEIRAMHDTTMRSVHGAEAELATINKCIAAVMPLRKFAHLPDAEAHEASQHEEWRLQLLRDAQNQLVCTGTVSPELMSTMRSHPAFKDEMLPQFNQLKLSIEGARGNLSKLNGLLVEKNFDLPKLLE
jgi:hypothetical protein